jgi:hypothetical protein
VGRKLLVKKTEGESGHEREIRVNVYKFFSWVHLSDHDENFRCVGSNFNVDLRDKNYVGRNIGVRGYF